MSVIVFNIDRFLPGVPLEQIQKVREVFTYVKIAAELGGGKTNYCSVRQYLRNRDMSSADSRMAFEFLFNLGVVRAVGTGMDLEPEDVGPGEWEIGGVEVAPDFGSEYLVEIGGEMKMTDTQQDRL